MVREAIQKKSVQTVLVVLVAGIWLYNSWQIFSIQNEKEVIRQTHFLEIGDGEDLTIPDAVPFEYRGNFRDPFTPVLTSTASARPVNSSEPGEEVPDEPEQMPELTLTGIFENTAVIQDMNGGVHFAGPGDSIGDVILKSVNSNSITLSYMNKTLTIQLHTEHNEDRP